MRKPTQDLKNWLVKNYGSTATGSDSYFQSRAADAIAKGDLSIDEFNRLMADTDVEPGARVKSLVKDAIREAIGEGNGQKATIDDLFADGGPNVRVKSPCEQYSTTKATAVHAKTGQPVRDERGQPAQLPSELEYAKAGAWLKKLARRHSDNIVLAEHEEHLIEEMFAKDTWCGFYQNAWVTGLSGLAAKALLRDSTSGGSEIVPEWFDADLVQFPLLHSEIFPMIDLRQVPRGASVEGASVGNPTVTWGVGEGTPIGLFDTDSLVSAIDTTIHPVSVAVEVGRDFLADSPAEVGRVLVENIGQRMAAELDRVVVSGDGTSEPQGITNASIGSVNSANGASGPPTLGDYYGLLFGVGKQYRTAAMRNAFITNDTTYHRSCNIQVDPAETSTDQRPVLKSPDNVSNYVTAGVAHKIENNLGNGTAIFGALAKYRMYRRQGAETRWVDGGKELARKNEMLLIVRARYGGKVVDANAFAAATDMQS